MLWWLHANQPSTRPKLSYPTSLSCQADLSWVNQDVPKDRKQALVSTGGKTKLLGISKRGNPYLRKMFIHGARAVVLRAKREGSYLGQWMKSLEGRAARNVVIVATANKL